MIITREIDGKEVNIELTPGERWSAYKEEQRRCQIEDIKNRLREMVDADEIEGVSYYELVDNCDFIVDVQIDLDNGDTPEEYWILLDHCIERNFNEYFCKGGIS